jgi:hypothetical protein
VSKDIVVTFRLSYGACSGERERPRATTVPRATTLEIFIRRGLSC